MAEASTSSHQRSHHRSSVVLSSSTPFSNQHASPSTFAISSSAMLPNANPLLQPDATPSSLLSQYIPQQLSVHLDALRQELKGCEAEMKRLINSRYGDILSVGTTISAMKGSSLSLHQKLAQVSSGLREAHNFPNSLVEQVQQDRNGRNTAQHEIKNVAALLTIQQEAPEEIWTILDSVSSLIDQVPGLPTFQRLSTLLKCARSLSTAVSLYDALRLAGWELDAASNTKDISRLFPYPLEVRNTTLSSIKSEIRNSLEQVVEATSLGHDSGSTTQSGMEVSFRLTALALLGLVRLNTLQPKEAGKWYLAQKRHRLQKYLEELSDAAAQERTDGHQMLAKILRDMEETIKNYSRLFGPTGKPGSQVFSSLLLRLMAGSAHPSEGRSASWAASDETSLLPPEPLSALSIISNSSQVLAMLDEQSALRDWTPFFELDEISDVASQSQQTDLSAWVHSVLADELSSQAGHWAARSLAQHSSFSTLTGISSSRAQLARHVEPSIVSRVHTTAVEESSGIRLVRTAFQHLDALLSARALALATKHLDEWANGVLKQLSVLRNINTNGPFHSLPYEDLFLRSPPIAEPTDSSNLHASQNRPLCREQLDLILSELTWDLQPFVDSLRTRWNDFQDSKEDYFDACFGDEQIETEQEKQERRQWAQAEAASWKRLSLMTLQLIESFKPPDQPSQGSQKAIQLLSRAVQQLVELLSSTFSAPLDADESQQDLSGLLESLSRSSNELLSSVWKHQVIEQAGSILLGNQGEDSTAGRGTPSRRLLKALRHLDLESGKVIPLLPSNGSKRIQGRDQIGSVENLLSSLLLWLSARVQEDPSLSMRLKRADIETLAALLATNAGAQSSSEPASQTQGATMEALSSLRSHSQSTDVCPQTTELLEALSPYALLFGRIDGVPLPSAVASPPPPPPPPHQQQQQKTAIGGDAQWKPLFDIAPVRARIRGVEAG